MQIEVKKLSPGLVNSFYDFHCEKNGEGWCNCVAWWIPTWDGWGDRTAEQNKALRNDLFSKGQHDGYLLFVDGKVAGWAQCGRRDRLGKLKSQHKLTEDPDVWAITCFTISPSYRKKGLSHKFLKGILDDLKSSGIKYVQAFPKKGAKLEDGEVWTGPEALYKKAGFQVEREGQNISIYRAEL
jgi:GNAT superfamily N-acetyltransferase